ncbi:dGTP triphosphohydrolase [Olivibacter domesticus]|uniref:dGTPase n=1 Tax=Olivibacter domesticus TaxID=407022 RepID=A0A1H7GPU8_OLID1|nr:dNTP triphosphohydrolase [Olivibacter domesticus]SEK39567.1 dGTPase [Olivibacter domesticus]
MMKNQIWKKLLNPARLRTSDRQKENDPRNEFESDFGRIIFSPAIRRMHDKTQVFPLTADDNIHSRLTHSLEVMAIGYTFGLKICENADFVKSTGYDKSELERIICILLKNSCLIHDIGNPPFGHFGEEVIKNYFKEYFYSASNTKNLSIDKERQEDFILFDGNAQGFRILTKLQVLNDPFGLNLTYGTLASFLKYPNYGNIEEKILSKSKRGVFQSEAEYLKTIFVDCGLLVGEDYIRHPLAFLMEAADSICYLIMDIEDGLNKGWYDYDVLERQLSVHSQLKNIFDRLNVKYSSPTDIIKKIVQFRIDVIALMVKDATDLFLAKIDNILEGKYNSELLFERPDAPAHTLKKFCSEFIISNREIVSLEITGHSVLTGLLDYYIKFVFHENKKYRKRALSLISKSIISAVLYETNTFGEEGAFESLSDYNKLQVIVDFITGMTDQFALDHYQKISGQKII